jgi:hypothetical protein
VVIGEYLYLLQSKVEDNGDDVEPESMDMDNFVEEDQQDCDYGGGLGKNW